MGGRHILVDCKCEWCEKDFKARKARVEKGYGRFCSRTCANFWQAEEGKKTRGRKNAKKYLDKVKGQYFAHWVDVDGKQHSTTYARWAWEMNFGEVPEGYRVSFIDGDPLNVELSNLKLISKEEFGEAIRERLMGHEVSDETRQKIAESKIGKTLSDEHKKSISDGMKDAWSSEDSVFQTDEYREKLRGKKAWNEGMEMSEEYRHTLSEAQTQRWSNPEEREKLSKTLLNKYEDPNEVEKLSIAQKHRWNDEEIRNEQSKRMKKYFSENPNVGSKISKKLKGRVFTDEWRKKLSDSGRGKHAGPLHPKWKGGVTKIPYPPEFDKYRRRKVRERDGHICQACGVNLFGVRSPIHHVDGDKLNSDIDNLLLVCSGCHNTIHAHSQTDNQKIIELRGKLK